MKKTISTEELFKTGLTELQDIYKSEYDEEIDFLDLSNAETGDAKKAFFKSKDELIKKRVYRVIGIALKKQFSDPYALDKNNPSLTKTGANYGWYWFIEGNWETAIKAHPEQFALLREIRDSYYEQNETEKWSDNESYLWEDFKSRVSSERGLYKVIAIWLVSKLNKKQAGTIKQMLEQKLSTKHDLALDVFTFFMENVALKLILANPEIIIGLVSIMLNYGINSVEEMAKNDEELMDCEN